MAEDLISPESSVILAGRDVESVVGDQLEALANQVGARPWELVFVDDGSRDGTVDVVESYRNRLPALVLVRADVRNAYAARNLGLERSRGEQVLMCDADDRVPEGWVAAMQRHLLQADLVGGPTRAWWPARQKVEETVRNAATRPHLGFLPFASGCSFGCRREVFAQVGGWDDSLPSGGDAEFSWRAQLAGFEIAALPDDLAILYRQREGARDAFRQQLRQGQGQVLAFRRYRSAGVRRRPAADVAREWGRLAVKLPGALRSGQLAGWMARAGMVAGRITGSIRFRTVYL